MTQGSRWEIRTPGDTLTSTSTTSARKAQLGKGYGLNCARFAGFSSGYALVKLPMASYSLSAQPRS